MSEKNKDDEWIKYTNEVKAMLKDKPYPYGPNVFMYPKPK